MDEEGQVSKEEDQIAMGGVRLWRTVMLFRDEFFLLTVGFLILFVQVAATTYIPKLSKAYSESLFVARPATRCRALTALIFLL